MKRCNAESLVRKVMDTWHDGSLDLIISNVFTQLEKVLCFINEFKGGNNLVETKHGPTVDVKNCFIQNIEYSNDDVEEEEDNKMDGDGGEMEIAFEEGDVK